MSWCTVGITVTRVYSGLAPAGHSLSLCWGSCADLPTSLYLSPDWNVVVWHPTMSDTLFFLQQGVRFDPDLPQTIRLEFAKSNTKVSKPKQMIAPQAVTQPPLVHPLTGRADLTWAGLYPQYHSLNKYEALSPAFIHAGADLWPHPLNFANAEQLQQLQQQALLHPALQHQLPVRSFLWLTDVQGNGYVGRW